MKARLVLFGLLAAGCTSITPAATSQVPAQPLPTPVVVYVTLPPGATPTSTPVPAVTSTQTPTPTVAPPTRTPSPRPTPTPAPTPTPDETLPPGAFDGDYQVLTKREWQTILRAPDDHSFETVTVFGCISQFDSATGSDTFRAQASYKRQNYWYLYGDNALFSTSDESQVSDFFEGDVFRAQVIVLGSYTYDTTIGGSETVPWFTLDSILHQRGSC